MPVKRRFDVVSILFGLVAGMVASLFLFIRTDHFSGCAVVYQDVVYSPDRARKIIQYFTDCGATTGFQFSLTVAEDGGSLKEQARNPFFTAGGFKDDIMFRWNGNEMIDVIIPKGRSALKISDQSGGVHIRYTEN